MGTFKPPDICWRENTAGNKQLRRFLEHIDDNFILQLIEKPASRGVMPEFVLINKKGLVGNVKVKGGLGCSDQGKVEFKILRAERRVDSNLTVLDFMRADFGLFRDLLGKLPWYKTPEKKRTQESRSQSKDCLPEEQRTSSTWIYVKHKVGHCPTWHPKLERHEFDDAKIPALATKITRIVETRQKNLNGSNLNFSRRVEAINLENLIGEYSLWVMWWDDVPSVKWACTFPMLNNSLAGKFSGHLRIQAIFSVTGKYSINGERLRLPIISQFFPGYFDLAVVCAGFVLFSVKVINKQDYSFELWYEPNNLISSFSTLFHYMSSGCWSKISQYSHSLLLMLSNFIALFSVGSCTDKEMYAQYIFALANRLSAIKIAGWTVWSSFNFRFLVSAFL